MELLRTPTSIAKGVELPCAPRPKEDGAALHIRLDLQRVELPCAPLPEEDGAAKRATSKRYWVQRGVWRAEATRQLQR